MDKVYYRFKVEGVRSDPGNPGRILLRGKSFYTKKRVAPYIKVEDGYGGYGFEPTDEEALALKCEMTSGIKQLGPDYRISEYQVTRIEYVDEDDNVIVANTMNFNATGDLRTYRAVDFSVERQLKERNNQLSAQGN